jgi:hypothetical protein
MTKTGRRCIQPRHQHLRWYVCLASTWWFSAFPIFGVPILLPLTACVALVFLIGAGAGSHSAVLSRQMKFRELAICDTAASFARYGGALLCAALGGGCGRLPLGK